MTDFADYTDYQRIVDDMQGVIVSGGDQVRTKIAAFNGEYVDAVRQVNARLRNCADLLRRGQRGEAIRQCEAEPNLLESVAVLDFQERPLWIALAMQCGLLSPPELNIDMAGDLNEAYATEQPLDRLMRDHRLLALGSGPLDKRIAVLRKIRRADPENRIWEDDLREYERVRLEKLQLDIDKAERCRDLNALATLEDEVRSPEWLQPPPSFVVRRAIRAHGLLRRAVARKKLEKLAEELTRAFSDFDVERGNRLRSKWNAQAAIGISDDDDELLEIVAPAMEWLDAENDRTRLEKEYQEALAELEQALDEGVTSEQLDRLYHALDRFDEEMSATLKRRVAERFRSLETTSNRRNRLILLGIVMAVLAVGGLTAFGIARHLGAVTLQTHVAYVGTFVKDGKLAEARQYLDELEKDAPDVFHTPEIQKVRGDLQAAVTREEGRKARLAQHLSAARTYGVDEATWASFGHAVAELKKADEVAASDGERAEIKRLERDVAETRRRMQQAVDDEFTTEVDRLQERFANLDRTDLGTIEQLTAEARQLQNRPRVSGELLNPLAPMIARLRAIEAEERNRLNEFEYLGRITSALGNEDLFRTQLEQYVAQFPGTLRAASFDSVAKEEVAQWKGLRQWDLFVGRWSSRDFSTLTSEEAEAFLSEIENLRDAHTDLPEPQGLDDVGAFLEAVAERVDGNGESIHLELTDVFNHRTVAEFRMVETLAGKKYYFTKDPFELGDTLTFYYVIDLGLNETERLKLSVREIANPKAGESFDWTAPQTKFSQFAMDKLGELSDRNWESTFYAIINGLYTNDQIEPILRVQLLEPLLDVACRGSYCLKEGFQKHIEMLENARLDPTANWLDPDDSDGEKARQTAQRVLDRLGSFESAAQEANEILTSMRNVSFAPRHAWIGWLRKDADDEWTCATRAGTLQSQSGELVVFHPAADSDPAGFRKVGTLRDGQLRMEDPADAAFVEGRAVLVTSGKGPSG